MMDSDLVLVSRPGTEFEVNPMCLTPRSNCERDFMDPRSTLESGTDSAFVEAFERRGCLLWGREFSEPDRNFGDVGDVEEVVDFVEIVEVGEDEDDDTEGVAVLLDCSRCVKFWWVWLRFSEGDAWRRVEIKKFEGHQPFSLLSWTSTYHHSAENWRKMITSHHIILKVTYTLYICDIIIFVCSRNIYGFN